MNYEYNTYAELYMIPWWVIIGGFLGCVAILAVIACAGVFLVRRRHAEK
jgi:uncharacterized membrane protein YdcZ (DUF606 family)